GGGVAGLTAALYSARQGMRTLVITMDIGGQLLAAPRIENFPASPPISGFELANSILEQAREFGAEVIYDEAVGVEEAEGGFKVRCRGGEYEGRALILAVGKKPRKLGVPGEDLFAGRGVSYCAICDAPLYRGRKVAVVGWGEQAHEAASILGNYHNRVYVIHSGRPMEGDRILRELRELGAEVMPGMRVEEIAGDTVVRKLIMRRLDDGERVELEVDGVFVELGYAADTGWLKEFVQLNERGEIIVDRLGRTSRRGVFAAGDVCDMPYKQAVIAAAQGAIAALSAHNYLRGLSGEPEIRGDWRKLKP
ncbi:MAG: FAD-dependent oxidoreductase, partial [Nitrososphaerota archaeon]